MRNASLVAFLRIWDLTRKASGNSQTPFAFGFLGSEFRFVVQ